LDKLAGVFKKLNPGARIIQSQFGAVDPKSILNTKTFDLKSASMMPGWKAELKGVQHKPETEEYGISSFVYGMDRPFHPDRLEQALSLASGAFPGVLRSKGYAWIASETWWAVEWSQAGFMTTLKAAFPWESCGTPAAKSGTRRQELVFIGNAMDESAVRETLGRILLTDEEFALGAEAWMQWPTIISKPVVLPEDKGRDPEFTVDLVKENVGDMIGLRVDEDDEIEILELNEGGLFHKWNTEKAAENPELVVKVGYEVKAVNGIEGLEGMTLIGSSAHLQFRISRHLANRRRKMERRFSRVFAKEP
jgi:hypothetical protein